MQSINEIALTILEVLSFFSAMECPVCCSGLRKWQISQKAKHFFCNMTIVFPVDIQ